MPLPAPTTLAHLVTDEATARAIADGLSELFDPEEIATAAFEIASLEAGLRGASTAPAKVAPAKQGREGAMGTLHPDETGRGGWNCISLLSPTRMKSARSWPDFHPMRRRKRWFLNPSPQRIGSLPRWKG